MTRSKALQAASFLSAAAFVLAMTRVEPALAWWTRQHPSECAQSSATGTFGFFAEGMGNTHATDNVSIVCPIPDTSDYLKTAIVTRNVHVYDGNNDATGGSISIWPCISYWDVTGGLCGSADSTSTTGTGIDTLSVPFLTIWSDNGADFGYYDISLPDVDVGTSYVKGWFTSN